MRDTYYEEAASRHTDMLAAEYEYENYQVQLSRMIWAGEVKWWPGPGRVAPPGSEFRSTQLVMMFSEDHSEVLYMVNGFRVTPETFRDVVNMFPQLTVTTSALTDNLKDIAYALDSMSSNMRTLGDAMYNQVSDSLDGIASALASKKRK